ncbi:MAG: ABC transporter ATP-binding protein [Myxococcales bacterium]|nr:ABC transporter ATP-binding protein [Myxococcales bacterium]
MIELASVVKRFHGRVVLDHLSLRVGAGEIVGLIGRNGAGKSTALRVLTGQLVSDGGTATIGGHDVQSAPLAARRLLGYVPQDGEVEPFLTGEEVLRFCAEVRGVAGGEDVVLGLLRTFGLFEARHRLTREYSEGMARRLALAASLVGAPPAFVLDEPLNGLDPRGVHLVRDTLARRAQEGAAILLTGHFLETLERLCTRVVLIEKGVVARDLDAAMLAGLRAAGRSLEDVFLEVVAPAEL